MTSRKDRLKKLVHVQAQLKALHETRHANFLSAAATAEEEAAALIKRFDQPGTLSDLFPDLYHQRIAGAAARSEANLESARHEALNIATATARTNMVERTYREARQSEEREHSDRERLDIIEQRRSKR